MNELKISKSSQLEVLKEEMTKNVKYVETNELSKFIIYSPEISTLRIYEKESQIKPLGINGEGILKYAIKLIEEKQQEDGLVNFMSLISWFKGFDNSNSDNSPYLYLKDKFTNKFELDQRNTNEGFLFLLFYYTLFTSKETPDFFAIDNIDSALNPKLCTELIKRLAILGNKNSKQVILTTHNPSVLDGIDLSNPEHSLHVVYRVVY